MAKGNIEQFNSPVDELHPSDRGPDALAQAGRHIGAEYNEAGRAYQEAIDRGAGPIAKVIDQHDTLDEISHGSAALAAMHNNFTTQWNEMASKADPNDKSIQGTFLNNTVDPALDQWQASFQTERGQQWAVSQADSLRTHLYEKTASDMSYRAGEARVKNLTTQLNQLSSVAYKDPTSVDQSMGQINALLAAAKENSDGMMSPEQIGKLDTIADDMRNEVVKSAIKGYADSPSPNGAKAAKAILDSKVYDQYIPAKEQQTLRNYIDNQQDSRDVEDVQKKQIATAQQAQVNRQEVNSVFSQLASGKGYLATMAFGNQNLTPQQRTDFVAKKDGILTLPQEFLSSPSYGPGFSQAVQGVYSGAAISPNALTAGVRRQEITPAGAMQLQTLADKMKTPEGLAEANAQAQVLAQMRNQIIKGGPNANDPVGQKRYSDMLNSFYPAWDAAIREGKSPAALADPNSKDYIGNLANAFKRTDAQALADVTTANVPKPKDIIPPPEKRVVGQAYATPRGDMIWQGNGWLPAKQQTGK